MINVRNLIKACNKCQSDHINRHLILLLISGKVVVLDPKIMNGESKIYIRRKNVLVELARI